MHGLSSAQLLDIWERGYAASPPLRGLLLLAIVYPQAARSTLLDMSIGQRDAALLALWQHTFGDTLAGYAECPQCGAALEFDLRASDLLLIEVPDQPTVAMPQTLALPDGDLRFRPPTIRDLLTVVHASDAVVALRQCCLIDTPSEMTDDRWAMFDAALEECDPQANLVLHMACPSCGAAVERLFDVVHYWWAEIDVRARRLLQEVHGLARTYGWREADVLALSPWRRQIYLNMAGAM